WWRRSRAGTIRKPYRLASHERASHCPGGTVRRRSRLPPGLQGRIGNPGFEAFRKAPRHEQIEALRLAAMKQDRHPVKLGPRRSSGGKSRSLEVEGNPLGKHLRAA